MFAVFSRVCLLRAASCVAFAASSALVVASCGTETSPLPSPNPPAPSVAPNVAAIPAARDVEEAPSSGVCPAGMALIQGNYCLTPEPVCLERQEIPSGERGMVEGYCLRYASPVKCYDDRREPMRFCMDEYEWPNKKGELPRTLTSWSDAKEACENAGKRLCTEREFNFACEGEEMRPYVYGFERDSSKCNFDKPYRKRTFTFVPWEQCQADARCKAAFDAIDQRAPSGATPGCKSPEGVYDLNGNVNEWVNIPDGKPPHRSGLKGGWWGPVRDRCRPTVTFHDEGDFGYEVGFRCCADAPG